MARASSDEARKSATCEFLNLADDYIDDLASVIDMEAIRKSGIRIGVDPLGSGCDRILEIDRGSLWLEYRGHQPDDRSMLRFHDTRS